MQTGSYKINGKNWWFKYREKVIENGVKEWKDRQVKLCLVDRDHQPKLDKDTGKLVAPESVRKLAVDYLAKVNSANHTPLSADSLESFLDSLLDKGVFGSGEKLRQTSLKSNHEYMRLIRPHLTDVELNRVDTPYIDRLLRALADADDATDNGRRAHTTYRNIKNSFLSSAFKYAVRHGLVKFNPVRDAVAPKGKEADTHACSLEEFKEFINALDSEGENKNHTAEAALVVAMFTGLRVSEIRGLRWEDYDRKKQVLNIQRTVDADGKVQDVKTDASKAPVPVVGIVKKKLEAHLERNSGDGFIFHAEDRSEVPIRFENMLSRNILPVFEKNEVEWHGWHAFRRGLSTELHSNGTDELRIKHILRHSIEGSDTAGRHYIDATADREIEASRRELQKVEARYKRLK